MTNTHITIGGHKVSAGKAYSTSEVKTGDVWTDGKPIYRKVVTFTSPTVDPSSVTIPIGAPDAITIVKSYVTIQTATGRNYITLPYYYTTTAYANYYFSPSGLIVYVAGADYINKQGFAIIEYTKTTD